MVDSVGQFKVEIYQNGTLIGSDVQTVTDASDPLGIIPNPTPEDETIEEGSDGTVVYTPILVKRGQTTKFKDMTFSSSSWMLLALSLIRKILKQQQLREQLLKKCVNRHPVMSQ